MAVNQRMFFHWAASVMWCTGRWRLLMLFVLVCTLLLVAMDRLHVYKPLESSDLKHSGFSHTKETVINVVENTTIPNTMKKSNSILSVMYQRILHTKEDYSNIAFETKILAFNNELTRRENLSHQMPFFTKQYVSRTFKDPWWCDVKCTAGTPCEYMDEVNLRIIVMTFQRPSSLLKCLNHIFQLQTFGDSISVEIWMDRSRDGLVSEESFKVAEAFKTQWQKGINRRACVHIWPRNVGITGQWTDTWRPKENTQELAIILEDDVDISPWAYKWLKAVHTKYGHLEDITGYTLQMQNINFFAGNHGVMNGPLEDTVFMYPVLGTWGFCPHPANWRLYQTWSHKVRESKTFKPYVEGIEPTKWYMEFEKNGKEDTMWEMWHIYFSHIYNLHCIYCNLVAKTGHENVLLSWNRKEAGLHFSDGGALEESTNLLIDWEENYVAFPNSTVQFLYDGTVNRRV